MSEAKWVEAEPCTCDHGPQEHDLYGCRQRHLGDPACQCTGVFGQVHSEEEYEAAMAYTRQYLERISSVPSVPPPPVDPPGTPGR